MKSAYVGVLSIIELKNARWNIENLLIVLCPIQRPITSQDCVLLRDNSLVFTVRLRPEISFRACLRVLTRPSFLSFLRPCSPHRAPTESKLHLSSTLLLSLKFPGKRTLQQVPQWGPYEERCPFPEPSFTNRSEPPPQKEGLLMKQNLTFLKDPGIGDPLHVPPNRTPYG